ncbi:MAG: hypothetical protein R6U89_01015 [Dehalococcoidia bacterium]
MEDREKLKHILSHWMEHNDEHAGEFREWADKAERLGEMAVRDRIVEAIEQLKKVNEVLKGASLELSDS